MGQNFTIVLIILTFILTNAKSDIISPKKESETGTHINLQSLTSLQLNDQTPPKKLDQSFLLMRDTKLQKEDPSVTHDKDRWELILSKTHPYKSKFQHDRDKYKQKSRLIK